MKVPHTRLAKWEPNRASKFGSLIQTADAGGCRIALIGLGDDTGVRLNGGRLGAAWGPSTFRWALSQYGVACPGGWEWPRVFDAGDIEVGRDIHETHEWVTEAVGAVLEAGLLPVGIGGGHDLTFPFVRAVTQRSPQPMRGVYFDAHLDVRAEVGSGMPFRALVEQCGVRGLHVHGLDEFANAAEHVAWFAKHGGVIEPAGALPAPGTWPSGELFISLDLDVIDAAYAPGVSAMNPSGWTPAQAAAWARAAGRELRVRCFDIMELSPAHDRGNRTARVAAHVFLSFLRGFAERPA